tara:strand:+ start:418 stop:2199 length:1782 start_codon:yes stop_codon:yes gene_type:complete
MGRPGMSARWVPTSSGVGAAGGGAGGGGGPGIYTEEVFTYTGGAQTFNTSKTDGTPITAYVFGPGGGAEGDTNTRGGAGGYSEGEIDISSGGTLKIIVGGHGGPGQQNNGSGAGYAGVFTSSWNGNSVGTDHGASIILAGGGGGSANSSSGYSHGGGAGGGSSGQQGQHSTGGYGGSQSSGGSYRQTGGGYCSGGQCSGTQLRGGVACGGGQGSSGVGWPNQIYGGNYGSAAGGNGCNAGAGGAGYYGGAGGASSPNGGNGGGGSGYIGGHPSYPVSAAATYTGSGDTPHSSARNSPFYSGQISYGGRHSHNRGNGSHQGGSAKVVITYYAPGAGGGGGGNPAGPEWDIIMHTNGRKGGESNQGNTQRFGYTGQSSWRSISSGSTGADGRTSFGAGVGLYNGYFQKKGITKVALVTGDGDLQNPSSNSKYLVYNLVEDSGSESFHDIINRLDQYNRNQSNWAGQNANQFNSPSVTNFTSNSNGYSGQLAENSGWSGAASNGSTPDKFAVWGINTDSDDDTQVLCSYYGSLSSGKGDSWRGGNPSQTFWSYWGNDWHSNSNSQTISNGKQSDPGIANGSNYSNSLYLIALGDAM